MFRTTIFLMLVLAVAGAAQAQTPPPASAPPSPLSFYPERAQRMEMNGDTVLDCNVTIEGRLDDCRLVSETPPGYGFGEASLKLSQAWKMNPSRDATGNPIPGGRLTIPLKWRVPK